MNCKKNDKFIIVNIFSVSLMLVFIVYCYLYYSKTNSLPAPFFYDSGDSFMDYFNVNWWSMREGAYTHWKSVYSPFNLWIANQLVTDSCVNLSSPFELRACDFKIFITNLIILLITNLFLFYKIKKDIPTIIFLSISMPMLYAIERGNYIIFLLTLLSLYVLCWQNDFISSAIILPLIIACKLYMAILILPLLIIKGFKPAILAIINYLALCIVFGFFIKDNNWILIPINLFTFQGSINSTEMMWASVGFSGIIAYINKFSHNSIAISGAFIFGSCVNIFILVRLLIYMKEVNNYKPDLIYILFLTLIAVTSVISSIGYYGLIIIFPFYLYCDSRSMIDIKNKILFYLTIIPYVVTMGSFTVEGRVSIFDAERISYTREFPVENIFVPLLMLVLFYRLTSKNIFFKNEN